MYSYSDFVPVSETFVNCQILPSSPRRWWGPAAQPRPKSSSIAAGNSTCVESTSVSGAPDNSSLSHVSATTRPCWLRRAVRNRYRHAIEQASRRWRGGRREDSARTRRNSLISTQNSTRTHPRLNKYMRSHHRPPQSLSTRRRNASTCVFGFVRRLSLSSNKASKFLGAVSRGSPTTFCTVNCLRRSSRVRRLRFSIPLGLSA